MRDTTGKNAKSVSTIGELTAEWHILKMPVAARDMFTSTRTELTSVDTLGRAPQS
jgi:hypothetical protein